MAQAHDAESIVRLHHRASDWYAQNGLIEEAIRHALAAGDPGLAGDIIEQHKDELLNTDQRIILKKWLSYLPDEVIGQRAGLLLAQMWLLEFYHEFAAIPPLLQQLDALLEAAVVDPATAGQRELFQGIQLFWRGQVEPSLEYFQVALALLPPANEQARASAIIYLATAKQMVGQGEEMIRTLQAWLHQERKDSVFKTRLLGSLVFLHYLSGKLTPVSYYAKEVLEIGQRIGVDFVIGWAHFVLGQVHLDWHMPDEAVLHFSRAVEYRQFLEQFPRVESFIGLALAYHGLGREEDADTAMKQLMTHLEMRPSPHSTLAARSAQVRLAILRDDMEKVRYLQRVTDFSSSPETMLFRLELPQITRCRLLIALGTPSSLETAVQLLTEHLQIARQTHNVYQQVIMLPLLALAHRRQGQIKKAVNVLAEAVSLAEHGSIIRPFVELGEEMAGLLKALKESIRQPKQREFIRQLLEAFAPEQKRKTPAIAAQLADPLTSRELEVLTLIARRLSNREIASALFISETTVKRHASNIFLKLQVHRRLEAVEKAYALGIL